ncbi:MAG: Rieske 2Fe-2S domain-containing protein [Sphingopyxis sp.]|nr:Rieske 2Fe-2S domain-containing protein [Sphingopyxis sp.]
MTELAAKSPLRVSAGGKKMLVFLVEGEPVATVPRCPHAAGPLHEGEVCGTILTCPWHGWTFDLATGACEEDPDLTLQRFETRREGDDIYVTP